LLEAPAPAAADARVTARALAANVAGPSGGLFVVVVVVVAAGFRCAAPAAATLAAFSSHLASLFQDVGGETEEGSDDNQAKE
jgi:hypothetical protein